MKQTLGNRIAEKRRAKHLRMMFREIKRLKRKYRDQGWNLVEVQEANGDSVTVQF